MRDEGRNGTVRITIDGRPVDVPSDAQLLEVLRGQGVEIPTLCHHPSLTPNGACRLCSVEVSQASWNGWRKLVTSCLYPVKEGLEVYTRSERVSKNRRTLLELYLARCPESPELQALARAEGVDVTSYPLRENADKCMLCGLCTRACQELGPGAISTLYRGTEKEVGPNPSGVGEECTACLTCAHICPTEAITFERKGENLNIWKRDFEIPVAKVKAENCRGCGICEESCPLAVPRVAAFENGSFVSKISANSCIGCGICVGNCPTGAIEQPKAEIKEGTTIFACSRSRLPKDTEGLTVVPCIGRLSIDTILETLAKGKDGVLLMCRDQATCPYGTGGSKGQERATLANELAKSVGLGDGRVRYVKPESGWTGPREAVKAFRESLTPTPLQGKYEGTKLGGLDKSLNIIRWLKERDELKAQLPDNVAPLFKELTGDEALLYVGELPEMDLLLAPYLPDWRFFGLLENGVKLLQEKGIKASVAHSRIAVEESSAKNVYTFAGGIEFKRDVEVITLDEVAGFNVLEANEVKFRMSRDERLAHIDRLRQAPAGIRCSSPYELAQFCLLQREGSWQTVMAGAPFMAFCQRGEDDEEKKDLRITNHPIMPALEEPTVTFTFNGKTYKGRENEFITSALYSNGVSVFGHHHRDGGAQGIYCVNGQCSQCMVVADGRPVKGCMVAIREGMVVESCEGHAVLGEKGPKGNTEPRFEQVETTVFIVGGGPAGICAAIELGKLGVDVTLVDDKQELGGKLGLQTHNFFGSVADCYAGTRGMDIGRQIADEAMNLPTVNVWLNSTVVGIYTDGMMGVSTNGKYRLVKPEVTLIAAGAREKSLVFPGCDLPGVYGAGAFQTLVNRDLVRCAERLFVIGGGNVGLIGAYHALQAGIDVVGLVEAAPRCGGYKVHEDKIRRLGVPVWTKHTVVRVEGKEKAERVVIAEVDDKFQVIEGTSRYFDVDTVLVAVGLSPVDEILVKAQEYGMKVYAAGDAEEIAEASAAIFSGKITGRKIAQELGIDVPIPSDWESFGDILKHRPCDPAPLNLPDKDDDVVPLIRCVQEIPCNPCIEACPKKFISMEESILTCPDFSGECMGCGQCVLACPGLAINLLYNDYSTSGKKSLLMMPFEFVDEVVPLGKEVTTTDMEGQVIGKGKVIAVRKGERQGCRKLLFVEIPESDKLKVAGFFIREPDNGTTIDTAASEEDDPIVCRCERVRKSEIVEEIRAGVRDINQLKASIRTCSGACAGKTCKELIMRIYREEGVDLSEVTQMSIRPLVAEVHCGDFVSSEGGDGND